MRVAIPIPIKIIEIWYESMSGASRSPAPKAIHRIREERVSDFLTMNASKAKAGRA